MLQAKTLAMESAKLQMRAAAASLKAVEEGINLHAQNRDYGKLKETAEASGLAAKVGTSRLHDTSTVLCCTDGSCGIASASPLHDNSVPRRLSSLAKLRGCPGSCLAEMQGRIVLGRSVGHLIWKGGKRSIWGSEMSCRHESECVSCAQAVASAQLSVEGWSANTSESRAAAIDAAKDASESAQMCHKFMRSIQTKA